jgi:hypothetical protein
VARAKRVVFLAVQDLSYPRNVRFRAFLEEAGIDVAVVPLEGRGPRWRRWRRAVETLVLRGRNADHYVLSEFSNKFAGLAWIWAKLNGGTLLVDGFVGLHETRIGDWRDAEPGSLASRGYRVLDHLAVRLSQTYFIDTELRAEAVRRRHPRASVRSLPVGAPAWAIKGVPSDPLTPRRVLFYGNYLPLHGADRIVEAIGILKKTCASSFSVTMIGSGSGREAVQRLAQARDVADVITFLDAMPEDRLAEHVQVADVVMGVFGTSDKAKSVIPNKVWQGLACGAVVVTQRSRALAEIEPIVGQQLIQTDPSPEEISKHVGIALERAGDLVTTGTSEALEAYVQMRFAKALADMLEPPVRTGGVSETGERE